jgi:hypothetical protein
VLWRAPVGGNGGLLGVDVFPALLVMQLVWLVTWTPGIEQGIVTGLGVALATASVRSRQAKNPRAATVPGRG